MSVICGNVLKLCSFAHRRLIRKLHSSQVGPKIVSSFVSRISRNNLQLMRHCTVDTTKTLVFETPEQLEPETIDLAKLYEEEIDTSPSQEFLAKLTPEEQRQVQILQLEIEVCRQYGQSVPKKISDSSWTEILGFPGRMKRVKYYRYLCITEFRQEKDKKLKEEKRAELEQVRKERAEKHGSDFDYYMTYGLTKNSIFLRINEPHMVQTYNSWLMNALKFGGESLIFDMGYGPHMTPRECLRCAEQVSDVVSINRQNRQPFYLHFCNLPKEGTVTQCMQKVFPNLYTDTFMADVSEQSYLDLFPKEKLVYLTPHVYEDLKEFNHDDIYIVGGFVDAHNPSPVSLAKAKKEGLRMARLPIDRYLDWGLGGKSLTLDQMMKILLDIKNTKDWNIALQHVPKRKLFRDDVDGPRPFNRKLRHQKLYRPDKFVTASNNV